MKTIGLSLILMVFFSTMSLNNTINAQQESSANTKVDVYYFHATKRCPTCQAIEKETLKTLNNSFSEQMNEGIVKLHILNIEENENSDIVENYEISGSSLILVPADGGDPVNLTNKAFLYARDQAFAFRKTLKENLNKLL